MEDLRIAYERPDGGVDVIVPAPNNIINKVTREWLPVPLKYWPLQEMPPGWRAATIADVAAKDCPASEHYLVAPDEIPSDRTFRAAWKMDKSNVRAVVGVDMDTAKEVWRNKWREVREPLLKKADTEVAKATDRKDVNALNEATAKRQALRDVTLTDLSHVTTPEELKAVWPEVLGEKPEV